MREMGEEYAARLGYADAAFTTSLHQWMGGFPQDESKAYGIICAGAAVAAWGGASMTIVKTPDEAAVLNMLLEKVQDPRWKQRIKARLAQRGG